MVPKEDRIIIVEAYGPINESSGPVFTNNNAVPARIEWKLVEQTDNLENNNESEIRHDIVGFILLPFFISPN